MTRVKFVKNTDRFGINAAPFLQDEDARLAIKKGDAIAAPVVQSVDGNGDQPHEVKRIRFVKDGGPGFPTGARVTLRSEVADTHIKAGRAEEFAIGSIEKTAEPENKMIKNAPRVKAVA